VIQIALVYTLVLLALMPSTACAQDLPPKLVAFLQAQVGLTSREVTAAASGSPVVKVLGDSDAKEIALVGIVAVNAPRGAYVAQVTDSLASRHDPSRLGSGTFSDPAVLGDVATLTIPHSDVQDLAKCRPGSCKLKLPVRSITDLRSIIDPHSPSADSVARAYFARAMIAYVTAYRARGKAALVVYDDQAHPIASSDVWAGILSRSPYMFEYAPALQRYLANYPEDRPANVSDRFVWGEDDVPGAKPILTVSHQVVYQPPELAGVTLVATEMLYSDHYLDGSLDLTAVIDRTVGSDTSGVAVVIVRRLHFDDLPSGGILNIRGKVIGKMREQLEVFLRDTKRRSEAAYALERAGSS
jgi:hypothetical protein